jgi:hypothetical protein
MIIFIVTGNNNMRHNNNNNNNNNMRHTTTTTTTTITKHTHTKLNGLSLRALWQKLKDKQMDSSFTSFLPHHLISVEFTGRHASVNSATVYK